MLKRKGPLSPRRHSGEPKGRKILPLAFPRTQTLTLWKVLNFSTPNSSLRTCPVTEVSIHTEAFTLFQEERLGSHTQYSSRQSMYTVKDAHYLQAFTAEMLEGHTSEKTHSRLFPITRGGGLVPKCRHFLQRSSASNAPFYKPG